MNDGASPLPLAGIVALDFGQFLSAPSAALRLADLGARVIKIERPGSGDICRTLYISNLERDGDSTLFHSINRNKQSFAADLRDADSFAEVKALIAQADVLIQNFRPGVMKRLGLDYEAVRAINPAIVYGEITGYGGEGPWRDKPGQDLLVQSLSGLTRAGRGDGDPPQPFGLAITDMMAGAHLAQGILAALVRRSVTGAGAHVAVSLLESALDAQAVPLTAHMNGAGAEREMPAPGIYAASDGYVALEADALAYVASAAEPHGAPAPAGPRDARERLAARVKSRTAGEWLAALEEAGCAAAPVMDWTGLLAHEAFHALDFVQDVYRRGGAGLRTTRCPIRIDGVRPKSPIGSPRVGEHTGAIRREWLSGASQTQRS